MDPQEHRGDLGLQCVEHILSINEAPGYESSVEPSPGSRRGQKLIVGNGAGMPKQWQVTLNMGYSGVLLKSTFQVAATTRPLMSVGRICDRGLKCLFEKEKATVPSQDNVSVCEFERRGGPYIATLALNAPEGFGRLAR